MAELRYNPLLDDWTIVNGKRNKRPDMPKDFCAFCPGSGKVPDSYDVLKYDNDWPSMSTDPGEPDPVATDFFKTRPSYGKCEVILYSDDHHDNLHDLSQEHLEKLVRLWKDRFEEISQDEKIKYILTFENRGEEVGTTQAHPHGQLYAYAWMPLRLRLELDNSKAYYEEHGQALLAKLRDEELDYKERIIYQDDYFVVFIPFYTDWPYMTYVVPKDDKIQNFSEFSDEMISSLASILHDLQGAYDTLYDRVFPYMMGIYQNPLHSEEYKDSKNYYPFNIKFFPPLRGKNSIKWNASSETAAWARTNPRIPEECAAELREAWDKFKNK